MHAERDFLVKRVFPRLSDWCEQRQLRLVDIDLRWGVTEQDATRNRNVVNVCMRRIDACRPFFLCFLGQRYGWGPSLNDVSAETLAAFPGLEHAVTENASVTELEILHAVISPFHLAASPAAVPCGAAFFYARDRLPEDFPAEPQCLQRFYTDEAETELSKREFLLSRVRRLRNHVIPATGHPLLCYQVRWDASAATPELELALDCPSPFPVNAQRWRDQWREFAGIEISGTSDSVAAVDRGRAIEFNRRLTQGRLSDFTCADGPLEERICHDLQQAIAAQYPDHTERLPSAGLQRELDQHELFLFVCSQEFIGRGDDFADLDEYAAGVNPEPFVLTARAGTGKSTLLAAWLDCRRPQWGASRGRMVHFRFIGASDGSSSVFSLLSSLALELKQAGKYGKSIPDNVAELCAMFPEMLEAAGEKGQTILVLDGINQLHNGLRDLNWLPRRLPPKVRLIISLRSDAPGAPELLQSWRDTGRMRVREVPPFTAPEHRQKLVNAYLEQYFKQLDEQQVEELIASDGAENPLFLKVVLSELRVFGGFAGLSSRIRNAFGRTPESAFDAMLERLETETAFTAMDSASAAPEVFGLLAHGRHGLSAGELGELLCTTTDHSISPQQGIETALYYLRQMRPFLARREGRYDFFYDSLRIAATERSEKRRPAADWHRALEKHFRLAATSDGTWKTSAKRALSELPYHTLQSGQTEQLFELYSDMAYLDARCRSLRSGDESPATEHPEFLDLVNELHDAIPVLNAFDQEKGESSSALVRVLSDRNAMLARFPENAVQEIGNYLAEYSRSALSTAMMNAARRLPALLSLKSQTTPSAVRGHSSQLTALAVAPSGKEFLSGAVDGSVGYWSIEEEVPRWVLPAHEEDVTSIVFSHDGRLALTAGNDGGILIWDLSVVSRRLFRPIGPHASEAWVGGFLDSETALAGTAGIAFTLDLAGGAKLWSGPLCSSDVLALSPDGRTIVSAQAGGTRPYAIRLLSVGESNDVHVADLQRPAELVMFGPGGQSILAADPQGYIYNYTLEGTLAGRAFVNGQLASWCLMQGGTVTACTRSGAVHQVSLPSMEVRHLPAGLWRTTEAKTMAAVSRDQVLAGRSDGSIILADLQTTTAVRVWSGATNFVTATLLDDANATALAGLRLQGERVLGQGPYFISGGRVIPPAAEMHDQFITAVVALERRRVLTLDRDGVRVLWTGNKPKRLADVGLSLTCGNTWTEAGLGVAGTTEDIVCLIGCGPDVLKLPLLRNCDPPGISAVAAGGKPVQVIAAMQNSEVASAGRYQWRVKSASGMGTAAAINVTSGLAATGHAFGKVHLWNRETGEEIWQMALHTGPVDALAFACDGLLYTTGTDGCVLAIEPKTHRIVAATNLASSAIALRPGDRGAVVAVDSRGRLYGFAPSEPGQAHESISLPGTLRRLSKIFR